MRSFFLLFFVCLSISGFAESSDEAQGAPRRIRVLGSSTIYPYSTAVAEHFGALTTFPAPIIESTGTGGGIRIFCSGKGPRTPDVVNASRPMSNNELRLCRKNEVGPVIKVVIGQDGIVLVGAHSGNIKPFRLSRGELFNALSAYVRVGDQRVKNPYKTWSQIHKRLPNIPIRILGNPPTAGAYDVFIHTALKPICEEDPLLRPKCGRIRSDGAYIAASEYSSVIVQKLLTQPKAVGLVGYNFYQKNGDRLWAAHINSVLPNFRTIRDKLYPLSYNLYMYFKADHINKASGLREYATEFLLEHASGPHGYLTTMGLVPLSFEQREKQWQRIRTLRPVTPSDEN